MWPGWVLVVAGQHEAVLVVGAVARSTAAGEHHEEGHGISPASRSTALQRASAGQELDQFADVAGWVLVSHCTVTRKPGQRLGLQVLALAENLP